MASEPDHSISSSISIPKWMKSRITDRYDVEISALSPPNQDDSFLYIPYTKRNQPADPAKIVGVNSDTYSAARNTDSSFQSSFQPDQKHFEDSNKMEPFSLHGKNEKERPRFFKPIAPVDGFSGESSRYSHSVVQVAEQMVAEGLIGRPFKHDSETNQSRSCDPQLLRQRMRRGSKSLPASPITTPDSTPQIQRKNRLGAGVESAENKMKYPGGWFVTGLLGAHREYLSESLADLNSDDNNNGSLEKIDSSDILRRNKSSSMLFQLPEDKASKEDSRFVAQESSLTLKQAPSASVLAKSESAGAANKSRPKQAELREMNFWSPTSM